MLSQHTIIFFGHWTSAFNNCFSYVFPSDLLLFYFHLNIRKDAQRYVPCEVFPVYLKYSQEKNLRHNTECGLFGPHQGATDVSSVQCSLSFKSGQMFKSPFFLAAGYRDLACFGFLFEVAAAPLLRSFNPEVGKTYFLVAPLEARFISFWYWSGSSRN